MRTLPEPERIIRLPIELPTEEQMAQMAAHWTQTLSHPGIEASANEYALRPIQGYALTSIHEHRAMYGPLGVGCGKTLIALLAPRAHGTPGSKSLVLTFAKLRDQMLCQLDDYAAWYDIDPPHILSYEMLSTPKFASYLEKLAPSLIIADEAHALKEKNAARTARFLRYVRGARKAGRDVTFVPMSGTFTVKSLHDYAHLAELALGASSPIPRPNSGWVTLSEWADLLDVAPRNPPSVRAHRELGTLARWAEKACPAEFAPSPASESAQARARRAFAARVKSAPAVCMAGEPSFNGDVTFEFLTPDPSKDRRLAEINDYVAKAGRDWTLPDGTDILDPLRVSAALSQLSCGFYYRSSWPNDIPNIPWLRARSAFNAVVRTCVQEQRGGHDSPALVLKAIKDSPHTYLNAFEVEVYEAWLAVEHLDPPGQDTVWYSTWLVDYVRELFESGWNGIVWYEWRAVGARLRDAGLPVVMGGEKMPALDGQSPICLSASAHGTGFDLFMYRNNLVLTPRPNGGFWEQLCGRTARSSQRALRVGFEVLIHTPAMRANFTSAQRDAQYIAETMGSNPLLLRSL